MGQRDGGCPREQTVDLEGARRSPVWDRELGVDTLMCCAVFPFVICA